LLLKFGNVLMNSFNRTKKKCWFATTPEDISH